MNILIITQLYPQPDDTGDNKPTHTVEYFAKEWVKMGNSVVVAHCPSKFPFIFYLIPPKVKNELAGMTSNIFPSLKSRKKLYREEYGIKVYRYPMLKALPGKGYSKSQMRKQSKEIVQALNKISFVPELVVGHFANPSTEIVTNIAKHYNAKSSIVFHHDCTEGTVERYRLKELVPQIGAIGARSVIEVGQIKKILALSREPFICYSGAPNDAVEAAEKKCYKHDFNEGIKYIYVGSLIRRKHLGAVIRAFATVAEKEDTLRVVGGGPEEEKLKGLATQSAKSQQIVFTGKISRSDVLREMKVSNIFTLISDGETFGMVYLEAMLQGCLVIASKGGGFDGLIKDGINGFICEPGNQEMLAEIYKRIKNLSEAERNKIGQAAIDTAIHFSEREVAERYLNDILTNQDN